MGQIEINHTGSGGGIVLSSDGTDLLLGGSAIGGGGASALTIEAKTSAYTVVAADLGKVINCTANTFTISLTAASTLGAGFNVVIWNTSDTNQHAITIDPNSSETIDGLATLILRRGEGMQVVCDGSNFQTGDKKTMRGYADNILSTEARPVASGNRSISLGPLSTSTQAESFSAGYYARGTGAYSVAIGGRPTASSTGAIAIGFEASGTSVMATAIGGNSNSQGAKASGAGSVALGGSYVSGADGFAVAVKNNTSSYGASGANSVAIGKSAKATGTPSLAIGGQVALATGNHSVAIGSYSKAEAVGAIAISSEVSGYYTQASNSQAVAIGAIIVSSGYNSYGLGYDIEATASHAFSMGTQAKSAIKGKFAYASGRFAANGDAQGGMYILRADTTSATPEVLTTRNSNGDATDQIVAASDTCITFSGTVVAMQNGAQAYGSWKIEGLLVNDGGTTTVPTSAITVINNSSSWGLALSADNTNNALAVTVTGEASHNIRWVANVQTSEVTYA